MAVVSCRAHNKATFRQDFYVKHGSQFLPCKNMSRCKHVKAALCDKSHTYVLSVDAPQAEARQKQGRLNPFERPHTINRGPLGRD